MYSILKKGKLNFRFLQEARLPTIPWGPVGDQLYAVNQVWQGPYWAVRTQNRIPSSILEIVFWIVHFVWLSKIPTAERV
jgi:hypothetical protein